MFVWVRLTKHFTFADDKMLMVIETVMVFVKRHNYVFSCVNCNYGYGTVSPFLTHLTPPLPPTTNDQLPVLSPAKIPHNFQKILHK